MSTVCPRQSGGGRAYDDGTRQFVVPVVCFDEAGLPYVWNAETHRPAEAVRSEFVALVSDSYRSEFGDVIGKFLARLEERRTDRGKAISVGSFRAQLKAIHRWGEQKAADLTRIRPVIRSATQDKQLHETPEHPVHDGGDHPPNVPTATCTTPHPVLGTHKVRRRPWERAGARNLLLVARHARCT